MKNGFRVLDSDLHTMEPDGLWERYLDEPFKKFAPKFLRGTHNAPNQPVIQIGDLAIAEMSKRAHTAVVGKDLQRRAFERSPHYQIAHDRGYDSETHVGAMDIEGIDVAVIYGTRGRQVLMHDELDPKVAAALARAQQLDAGLLRVQARALEVCRPARFPRRRRVREGGPARREGAGRRRGHRQSEPDQRPAHPRPRVRAALGRHRGAGRAGRLPSHGPVVTPR